MPRIKTNEKGIGLVETIFALGISIIVLTSLVSLSLYTLRSSQQSKYMLEASKLATEEMERVRAVRDDNDTNWSVFRSAVLQCNGTTKCSVSTNLVINQIPETVGSNYTRYFIASEPDTNILRIAVTVSYEIGGQTKAVHNYTDLTNWRNN